MGVKLAPYLKGLFSAFVVLQRITKYFLAKKTFNEYYFEGSLAFISGL
jgi:hypothetical protein